MNATATATTTHGRLSWETCFETFNALPADIRGAIRANVRHHMAARSSGFDVGSSDVNHGIFAEYRMADGDWFAVVTSLVDRA